MRSRKPLTPLRRRVFLRGSVEGLIRFELPRTPRRHDDHFVTKRLPALVEARIVHCTARYKISKLDVAMAF
jgi:hypothetical protein